MAERQTIELPLDDLATFCRRWRICELALFGSAARTDFGPHSDVDLLATFADDADWSLLDGVRMSQELEQLLGRPVDLISRRAVERSTNQLRRDEILAGAHVIYRTPETQHAT
jgi:predicted nucleotidyltransferase